MTGQSEGAAGVVGIAAVVDETVGAVGVAAAPGVPCQSFEKQPASTRRWQQKHWMKAGMAEAVARMTKQIDPLRKANRRLRKALKRAEERIRVMNIQQNPATDDIPESPECITESFPVTSTPIGETTPRKRTQALLKQCGIGAPAPLLEKTLRTHFAITHGV